MNRAPLTLVTLAAAASLALAARRARTRRADQAIDELHHLIESLRQTGCLTRTQAKELVLLAPAFRDGDLTQALRHTCGDRRQITQLLSHAHATVGPYLPTAAGAHRLNPRYLPAPTGVLT